MAVLAKQEMMVVLYTFHRAFGTGVPETMPVFIPAENDTPMLFTAASVTYWEEPGSNVHRAFFYAFFFFLCSFLVGGWSHRLVMTHASKTVTKGRRHEIPKMNKKRKQQRWRPLWSVCRLCLHSAITLQEGAHSATRSQCKTIDKAVNAKHTMGSQCRHNTSDIWLRLKGKFIQL